MEVVGSSSNACYSVYCLDSYRERSLIIAGGVHPITHAPINPRAGLVVVARYSNAIFTKLAGRVRNLYYGGR